MDKFLAEFDWRTYCTQNGLKSRIEAIAHLVQRNKYSLQISKLPNLTFTSISVPKTTTSSVDLRSRLPPCYDQGQLGSCTANAFVAAYQFLTPSFYGSRLFLYYNERVLCGDVSYDGGAYVHNGVEALEQTGLCHESDWPYTISKFAQRPPAIAYTHGLNHKIIKNKVYNVQQTLTSMKGYLSAGFPFVVGIMVYSSFQSNTVLNNGLVPYPNTKSEKLLGGHCVLIVGFNDSIQCPNAPLGAFLARNSWGTNIYGSLKGYFWIPYNYLTNLNLTSDCWCVEADTN